MYPFVLMACSSLFPAFAHEAAQQPAPSPAPKVHKIAVGGEGGWDYLTVDSAARRLYVSRGNRVVVLDLDKETVVGELPDTPGIHGVAIVPELGETSPGKFAAVSTVTTQAGARTMTIDPKTHKLYLSAATAGPAPAPAAPRAEKAKTKGRRNMVPGSFVIIVVGD